MYGTAIFFSLQNATTVVGLDWDLIGLHTACLSEKYEMFTQMTLVIFLF